ICSSVSIFIKFNGFWIGELRSVICENDREKLHEHISSKMVVNVIEYINDRLCIIIFSSKSNHKCWHCKMNCKQTGSTFSAFNRINLDNMHVRIVFYKILEVLVPSSIHAF